MADYYGPADQRALYFKNMGMADPDAPGPMQAQEFPSAGDPGAGMSAGGMFAPQSQFQPQFQPQQMQNQMQAQQMEQGRGRGPMPQQQAMQPSYLNSAQASQFDALPQTERNKYMAGDWQRQQQGGGPMQNYRSGLAPQRQQMQSSYGQNMNMGGGPGGGGGWSGGIQRAPQRPQPQGMGQFQQGGGWNGPQRASRPVAQQDSFSGGGGGNSFGSGGMSGGWSEPSSKMQGDSFGGGGNGGWNKPARGGGGGINSKGSGGGGGWV